MTMGPAPMIRMELMSVRLGMVVLRAVSARAAALARKARGAAGWWAETAV